jgi:hypothetical protein
MTVFHCECSIYSLTGPVLTKLRGPVPPPTPWHSKWPGIGTIEPIAKPLDGVELSLISPLNSYSAQLDIHVDLFISWWRNSQDYMYKVSFIYRLCGLYYPCEHFCEGLAPETCHGRAHEWSAPFPIRAPAPCTYRAISLWPFSVQWFCIKLIVNL